MLGTQEQRTEGMKKQAQELIEQAYNRGYRAGYSKAENDYHANTENDRQSSYELGLNMAWEAARKICTNRFISDDRLAEIFGRGITIDDIMQDFSASEAIEKLRTYEEQKKQEEDSIIHVGDEVYLSDSAHTRVVTCIFENYGAITAVQITENGRWVVDNIRNLYKTGRHFPEIENVLEKLKEVE